MIKHNQDGGVSGLAISLILAIVLLVAAIGFGAWAFTSRQDYKNNSDAKAQAAAEAAVKANSIAKDKQFAEDAKKPFKTYHGPAAFGSLSITYPKTWSAYAATSEDGRTAGTGNSLVDAYFNPDVVPTLSSKSSVFALRAQVIEADYASTLKQLEGKVRDGKVTVSAYSLPSQKVSNIIGSKVEGEVEEGKKITMVVLPLRSQTVKIWTEGDQYLNDFNNIILPNFSFVP